MLILLLINKFLIFWIIKNDKFSSMIERFYANWMDRDGLIVCYNYKVLK